MHRAYRGQKIPPTSVTHRRLDPLSHIWNCKPIIGIFSDAAMKYSALNLLGSGMFVADTLAFRKQPRNVELHMCKVQPHRIAEGQSRKANLEICAAESKRKILLCEWNGQESRVLAPPSLRSLGEHLRLPAPSPQ
jgi:hypothetical protein